MCVNLMKVRCASGLAAGTTVVHQNASCAAAELKKLKSWFDSDKMEISQKTPDTEEETEVKLVLIDVVTVLELFLHLLCGTQIKQTPQERGERIRTRPGRTDIQGLI